MGLGFGLGGAVGSLGAGSLRSFAVLRTTRVGGAWEARPRADARRVAALGSARAEGDAPTGGCVILIDQRERRIPGYG